VETLGLPDPQDFPAVLDLLGPTVLREPLELLDRLVHLVWLVQSDLTDRTGFPEATVLLEQRDRLEVLDSQVQVVQ